MTTTYIGNWFEWTGSASTMKKYYYAGGARVAMRDSGTLYYLFGDHLGSTSVTATDTGARYAELRYKAWGEIRATYGTTPTKRHFTGQYQEEQAGGPVGLYYYGARWLDVSLGRFLSADSIIPQSTQGVQAFDRYAYANKDIAIRRNDQKFPVYRDPYSSFLDQVSNVLSPGVLVSVTSTIQVGKMTLQSEPIILYIVGLRI